jgi:mannose-6-phosphate isomerase
MYYPLKFKPIYKGYFWGGRNFEKFGKILPEGIVAESWEISCHPHGISEVINGDFTGAILTELIEKYGRGIIGTDFSKKNLIRFPLLLKLIDANNKLSVQVHPGNDYAFSHENGEMGKYEMWYILEAKPGAKLICDFVPNITKEVFARAIQSGSVENYLKYIPVFPGDVIYIPPGIIHSIGEGIVLVEVQQNSDITYRVYDYDRIDHNGRKRPLHIEKALDVIDFNTNGHREKTEGLFVKLGTVSQKKYLIANCYFAVELYTIREMIEETTDGSKFYIYSFIEGEGNILYKKGCVAVNRGESVLIPASLGAYSLYGNFKALKVYVPDLAKK